MSLLVIGCIFVASFIVAVLWGLGWAFVAVYLPSLILLNQLPEVPIPHAPLAAQFAPLYAILLAIPFRGESLKFKICSIDIIFVLLLLSATITAWTTEVFETGVNIFRTDFLNWTLPYLLARICFKDWKIRRGALYSLIAVLAIVSVAALIEFRMIPYFYLHKLQDIGMNNKIQPMAYERYGFNRVAGPVEHPIYFGNMCVVILGLIAVLARTSGLRLKNPWVAVALFSAFGCIITSISFTPYVGTIAGTGFLIVLTFSTLARKLLLPLTIGVVLLVGGYTYHVATQPLGEKPDGELPGSLWTRKMIISQSWMLARTAGPFGLGIRPDLSDIEGFDLKSVDNSYMQFTLTRGWVYTLLWISIAICFSYRMTLAFAAVTHPSQIFPLAASTATVLGLMLSMYTVWAGALYTVVWVIMLGLSNTLIDSVLESADARQRGFEVLGSRRPMGQPIGNYAPGYNANPALRLIDG
jgi:hypothetical protein